MDTVSNEWVLKKCSLKEDSIGQYGRSNLRWFVHDDRISVDQVTEQMYEEYTELNKKVQEAMEDIKLKQVSIFDYKKKLAEAMTKYKLQQNLFEMVRSDRNTFSKNLLEAQDEISELKQKLKVMGHQIEQMKEDITTKETQLMKEEFALQKTEKERENLREELQKLQQDIMNERDILGTQLVRRNDELALLYEKIKILQSTLHKGEAQYDQRLEDIRLLKLEIKRLRQEKALLSRSMTNMTDLKQEVFHLERDLTKEKLKCRALEEELQNPLNVHRWRKLEGSDPDTYELLQKIQLLQKRLLAQSDAAIERENRLRESERLYINLRQLLARQPGPEMSIRLQRTQRALKDRGRKMKCLISELNMYESQAAEYKFDLERVSHELNDAKKKYFVQKRREQKEKERAQEAIEPVVNETSLNKPRFTGGGFNLTAIPTKVQTVGYQV
uniref:Cilia- and flagella-associated protein 58 central coiled coil domain-containing protein n=1 Tax=Timema bartmani TaxID=61472 RepID=A0A7R9F861_9NEOP|nr:unnamed protein product [Timema bartmani]